MEFDSRLTQVALTCSIWKTAHIYHPIGGFVCPLIYKVGQRVKYVEMTCCSENNRWISNPGPKKLAVTSQVFLGFLGTSGVSAPLAQERTFL